MSYRQRRSKKKTHQVDYTHPRFQEWLESENRPKKGKAREYNRFSDLKPQRSWQDDRDEEIDGLSDIKLIKEVRAKTPGQQIVLDTIEDNEFIYILGEPGSGKTHLSIGAAVTALLNDEVERIVLIRPIVGVGKTSGFLPGGIDDKLHPFLIPLKDEIKKFISPKDLEKLRKDERIEILPLEYIRGRTLDNAFVIVDEAQNATFDELKVVVTRMGENSIFVVEGDINQSDLPPNERGALLSYSGRFQDIDGIATCRLHKVDIVRHPLVAQMIEVGLEREAA